MRWLLVKDLQILRRSPLLVGILIVYPIAIALMIGLAASSPPGKPKVAYYSGVPRGQGTITLGAQRIDVAGYARELLRSIDPVDVRSPGEAIADVRNGSTLAAVIVPSDITEQIESLVRSGVGTPTVQLVLNTRDPLEREYVRDAIDSRLAQVEGLVSRQVLQVGLSDLQRVLSGGVIGFFGEDYHLLGLRQSRTIIARTIAALPAGSRLIAPLRQVSAFASLAIGGLSFANPVLGSITSPLTVQVTQLAGRTTPTATYAVTIAAVVSLMFLTLLLAAGMLALERAENAYARLVRGLVSPTGVLAEKILLAAACGALVTLVMAAVVGAFVPLRFARFELWIAALGLGGLSFAALGTAIGGLARDLSTASLLAFLVSLPVAFVALVPSDAVSGALGGVLDVIAFAFPFRAALEAAQNAFTGSSPGIVLPLVHLLGLAVMFGGLARVAVHRFASP